MGTKLFELTLVSNWGEEVQFVNDTNNTYELYESGFDITTSRNTRQLAETRPGFWKVIHSMPTYREATIKFSVYGADREAVIDALHKIERVLAQTERRDSFFADPIAELHYSWATGAFTTYLQVIAGDIILPGDTWSIEKLLREDSSGNPYLPEVELKLYVGATAYKHPLVSGTPPLTWLLMSNPNYNGGTPSSVVQLDNPVDGAATNYVEIADTELDGGGPWRVNIRIQQLSAANWGRIYMGMMYEHPIYPFFPNGTHQDYGSATVTLIDGTTTKTGGTPVGSTSGASGSSYLRIPWTNTTGLHTNDQLQIGQLPFWGSWFIIMETYNKITTPTSKYLGLGFANGITSGITYVNPRATYTHPLGVIQWPMGGIMPTNALNNVQPYISLYQGRDDTGTGQYYDLDYMSYLPIDNGFRVLDLKYFGDDYKYFDDGFKQGVQYSDDTVGSNGSRLDGVTGLLDPLILQSNRDTRIYFHISDSDSASSYQKSKPFQLEIFGQPMYSTLAE
jgi:hypothetical protein